MSSTSSPSGADDPRPSADEAARALRNIDERRGQAQDSATNARWVYVVFGVLLCGLFAAPDFFGDTVVSWTSPVLAVLVVGHVVLLRTRRGSALLGQPVRPRREELSGPFRRYSQLAFLAVVLLGFALILWQPDWHLDVPYWRTAVGVVIGGALAGFGPSWQRGLLALATRNRPRTGEDTLDGAR